MIEGNKVTATFDVVAVGLQVRTNVEIVDPELCVCGMCAQRNKCGGTLIIANNESQDQGPKIGEL